MRGWSDVKFAKLVADGTPIGARITTPPGENESIARRCRELEERARLTAQRHEAMAAQQRAMHQCGMTPWEKAPT